MSKQFAFNPKLDFAVERFIDAPTRLVWEALTKPEHLKEWYMPKAWGRVSRTEMDVRPGGILSVDIATGDGQDCARRSLRWPRPGRAGAQPRNRSRHSLR
jgi:uncharacterized protein YndB with AHSA1/START domain